MVNRPLRPPLVIAFLNKTLNVYLCFSAKRMVRTKGIGEAMMEGIKKEKGTTNNLL